MPSISSLTCGVLPSPANPRIEMSLLMIPWLKRDRYVPGTLVRSSMVSSTCSYSSSSRPMRSTEPASRLVASDGACSDHDDRLEPVTLRLVGDRIWIPAHQRPLHRARRRAAKCEHAVSSRFLRCASEARVEAELDAARRRDRQLIGGDVGVVGVELVGEIATAQGELSERPGGTPLPPRAWCAHRPGCCSRCWCSSCRSSATRRSG